MNALSMLVLVSWPMAAHAEQNNGLGSELFVKLMSWLTTHASGILANAYERAPVLIAVLAALLILPLTALAALLAQSLYMNKRSPDDKRDRHRRNHGAAPTAPVQPVAWLTHPAGGRMHLPPSQSLVRIGRHEDNDIRLLEASVHRHHAIIHRTPDAQFIITDVSGEDGNGIVVNGNRLNETRLLPGDTVQLGNTAMTFDSALPAYLAAVRATRYSERTTNRG